MFDYHALTMDEPRDAPARRQQFLVICSIMAGCFAYTTIMAGLWSEIVVTEGTFPGGDFVYKSTKRDYAASAGLEEQVCTDLGLKVNQREDKIFSIFLDDPHVVTKGRSCRFASGFLSRRKGDNVLKNQLLAMNPSIEPPTVAEVLDLPAVRLWSRLRYKQASLPAAKAGVVHYTSTNGFVSSLIFSYRILPALRKYAAKKQSEAGIKPPVVTIISTCSVSDGMCTHYAPIQKGARFLLGQEPMEVYAASLPVRPMFDLTNIKRWVRITMRSMGLSKSDEL